MSNSSSNLLSQRDLDRIVEDTEILIKTDNHWLPALANTAALLFERMPGISWAGFYLFKGNSLMLGPFQGKVACVRINIGKGVCGTAFLNRETIIVANVHEFPGHIACDPDSRSEIVVPLKKGERTLGVLDIDSTSFSRFTTSDQEMLERVANLLILNCKIEEFVDC